MLMRPVVLGFARDGTTGRDAARQSLRRSHRHAADAQCQYEHNQRDATDRTFRNDQDLLVLSGGGLGWGNIPDIFARIRNGHGLRYRNDGDSSRNRDHVEPAKLSVLSRPVLYHAIGPGALLRAHRNQSDGKTDRHLRPAVTG